MLDEQLRCADRVQSITDCLDTCLNLIFCLCNIVLYVVLMLRCVYYDGSICYSMYGDLYHVGQFVCCVIKLHRVVPRINFTVR
jgi:hypothetical protein